MKKTPVLAALLLAAPGLVVAATTHLNVKATNKLSAGRVGQTIELSAKDLAGLAESNLQRIHVKDSAGRELLCQAVDTDFDPHRVPDMVMFQADFGAGETKSFTISTGAKQVYSQEQFKAHGRFVRERFDDFAWENDRIAHRMYGKALETCIGEPLTSSTVDIWSKRVPRMVIDTWYMVDNYHSDTGEGADFYSAGPSRGCGGNGLWVSGKLWVSKNFADSRVVANGPIRVMFELVYEPFDVNGVKVSEVKRITLDAGSNFDRFQSFYKIAGDLKPLVSAAGLKKVAGEQKKFNGERGCLLSWEKVEKNAGMQGVAIIAEAKSVENETEDKLNNLLLIKAGADNSVSYWAGFVWDKSGQCVDAGQWQRQVEQFAEDLGSPIEVSVSSQ